MKALENALAAKNLSDQLEILEAIPPKEYSKLFSATEAHRQDLYQRRTLLQEQPAELEAQLPEIEAQHRCLDIARIVTHLTRQKLPKAWRIDRDILELDEILNFFVRLTPAWLPGVIDKLIAGGWSYNEKSIEVAYRYIQAGAVPPPSQESRYYSMLPCIVSRHASGQLGLAKQFLRKNREIVERDLLTSIRMMATKGGPVIHGTVLGFSPHPDGRRIVLDETKDFLLLKPVSELCAEGDFDLRPLLQTTLEALLDAQREVEARHLLAVHDQLAPNRKQCMELQSSYCSLLASPHKAAVNFAIQMIGGLVALPGFDATGFILHVAPVFMLPSNPLQIAGLDLIRNVLKAHPNIADAIPPEIAPALLNPNLKVQSAVLALLQSLPESAFDSISTAIAPYAANILSSLKPRFTQWMNIPVPLEEPETLLSVKAGLELGERLQVLTSVEDLAFVANELLQRDLSPMRLELFLHGLARFAGENPGLLAEKFKPLQKRALHFSLDADSNGCHYPRSLIYASRLILIFGQSSAETADSSLESLLPPGTPGAPDPDDRWRFKSAMDFAVARIDELLNRIHAGCISPLLATPEFDLGFISPETLLKRLQECLGLGMPPGHFDFIQAITRCCPTELKSSSLAIPKSEDEASRVLRFLFSGEIHGDIQTPAWWLAAARTREPLGDFSIHPVFGRYDREHAPDWCMPAVYSAPPRNPFKWHASISPLLPEFARDIPPDHLYSRQHGSILPDTFGRWGSDLRWRYSFTPGLLDAVVAQDLQYTTYNASLTEKSAINAASAVMAELAIRRLPLRYTTQVHLLVALNSPGKAEREAGVDLFLQASKDGRLAAAVPEMGRVFSQLFPEDSDNSNYEVLQLGRLVPALRELTNHGALLQQQIRDILILGLEPVPKCLPKGFPGLLELLLDLVMAHPPMKAIDLNTAWGGLLEGKSKSLAGKIAKVARA